MIKAITIGSNIVQQKDINWSKRILGKLALTHIKIKIRIQDLKPKTIPQSIPSLKGSDNRVLFSLIKYSIFSKLKIWDRGSKWALCKASPIEYAKGIAKVDSIRFTKDAMNICKL